MAIAAQAGSSRSRDLGDFVDLSRYPLLDSRRRSGLVSRAQRQLMDESCVVLPGFIGRDLAERMATEVEGVVSRAHRRDKKLSAYANNPAANENVPDAHPTRQLFPFAQSVVATDLLPADGLLLGLYRQDALTALVADLLGEPVLHRSADPLLSCTATSMGDGDQHGWHFDSNDFVVSLLLRAPERGGVFEFAPYIRGESQQCYDDVAAVMEERSDKVRAKPVTAGTLMIFCGRRSLHRVSPIQGATARLIALFSYDRAPNMMFSDSARTRAVGRIEPLSAA